MHEHIALSAALIVTNDDFLADHLGRTLRTLDWIAVSVDRGDTALEMMDVVAFSLVVVDVVSAADWHVCRRLVQSGRSPIAVVTDFLAEDRSYRRFAFEMGVSAYTGKPCTPDGLREMLSRLERGERYIDLAAGKVKDLSGG